MVVYFEMIMKSTQFAFEGEKKHKIIIFLFLFSFSEQATVYMLLNQITSVQSGL